MQVISLDPAQLKMETTKSLSAVNLSALMDCPRTEIRKIEEELYNLSVKENDLKPYVRRFQELTILCPNMVPNNEKLLEIFIGGLPRSMKKRCCLETSNFGGSHQHIPEVNGSDNKTRFCARNQ
ncbi:hypothetical protein Tco_1263507 [Tanacetum coccineum]